MSLQHIRSTVSPQPQCAFAQLETTLATRINDCREKSHALHVCEWHNADENKRISLQRLHADRAIRNELQQASFRRMPMGLNLAAISSPRSSKCLSPMAARTVALLHTASTEKPCMTLPGWLQCHVLLEASVDVRGVPCAWLLDTARILLGFASRMDAP